MTSEIILITGANRGIGFAIAQSLAQDQRLHSPTLIISSRQVSNAENAVAELKQLSQNNANFDTLELDVDNDESITSAVTKLSTKYSKLDVLINNAGIFHPSPSLRTSFNQTLNTNVTSIAALTTSLLPLLRAAAAEKPPRVINISSGRASLTRVTTGKNPATDKIAYSVSKAALNLLTVEMAHSQEEGVVVEFQAVNPGWCKTGLNGWRGPKDPLEGAKGVVELVVAAKGEYEAPGFWEWVDDGMRAVPW